MSHEKGCRASCEWAPYLKPYGTQMVPHTWIKTLSYGGPDPYLDLDNPLWGTRLMLGLILTQPEFDSSGG